MKSKPSDDNAVPMTGRMLGAMFRIPYEAIRTAVNRALAEAGYDDITPAHQSVFQHLPPEGARITELAERAGMTKQSMGALVRQLEEGGYLARTPDPTDGRAVRIGLTARGRATERVARERIARVEAEWAAALGPERLRALREILQEIASMVEDEPAHE
jgi:DNA-binding MarR family transcriptional regulator